MTELFDLQKWGKSLISQLGLKSTPIGLKFLTRESEIPPGSFRPLKDKSQHLAQCQAFALSRQQGLTVTLIKEDHWCWGPLLGYGLADHRAALSIPETAHQAQILPRLEYGKYIGLVCAPLDHISYIPDIVLIYSNTAQLRNMLMALKFSQADIVNSQFDPIDSCVYAVVPTFTNRQIRITLPDPGESHRAGAQDDEIIITIPFEKIQILVEGLERSKDFSPPAKMTQDIGMIADFPRPDFYDRLFKLWNMEK
jgi:uncharacterized protein (DUF169 family)